MNRRIFRVSFYAVLIASFLMVWGCTNPAQTDNPPPDKTGGDTKANTISGTVYFEAGAPVTHKVFFAAFYYPQGGPAQIVSNAVDLGMTENQDQPFSVDISFPSAPVNGDFIWLQAWLDSDDNGVHGVGEGLADGITTAALTGNNPPDLVFPAVDAKVFYQGGGWVFANSTPQGMPFATAVKQGAKLLTDPVN